MVRFTLFALIVLTGCPGQRRPPPRTATAPPPKSAPEQIPQDVPPAAAVTRGTLESLQRDVAQLEADANAVFQSPDRSSWERFVERIDDVQTLGFDLQESGDEKTIETVYEVLEKLAALRDKAVRAQPR